MKPRARLVMTFALLACLCLMPTGYVTAQTFTNLHSFTATSGSSYVSPGPSTTNSDGSVPQASLVSSGNTLYGTADHGGVYGYGAVFAINADGTGFTNLHSFIGTDGAVPLTSLILSGNILYGAALSGGGSGKGTLFKINTDGTGFTNFYNFTAATGSAGFNNTGTNSDGDNPWGGLILSGNTLYGTAQNGGSSGNGTVFAVNTNGTGFANLHSFKTLIFGTNSDGAIPHGGLVLSSNTLYGTTQYGGLSFDGTVFAVSTDGIDFTNMHSFTIFSGPKQTNSDGAIPLSGLVLSGSTLYGMASQGGIAGAGVVFAIHTNGTDFTNLYSFAAGSGGSQGGDPQSGLILSGNTLYGTTFFGGTFNVGAVFAVNTNGLSFTNLYSFTGFSDGDNPWGGLILSGNTLYGTTWAGGSSTNGTVFSLTLASPPQLAIIPSGVNIIMTWPTNANGFTLQSTTNLAPPGVWNTVSPAPVTVNGQNTVTNPITSTQQFFRLSHP